MRPLLTTLAGAAALALGLAAAADADAARVAEARFTLTVTGGQETYWIEPRHTTYIDCYHTFWTSGRGSETVDFRSPRKVKLLAYRTPSGSIFLRYGTHSRTSERSLGGAPVHGRVVRQGRWVQGHEPGECGGTSAIDPAPEQDCGARGHDWEASIDQRSRRRVVLDVSTRIHNPVIETEYEECPIVLPYTDDAVLVSNAMTEIEAGFPAKDLFDPRRKRIVLRARQTFRMSRPRGFGGVLNAQTEVDWTATLVRVR